MDWPARFEELTSKKGQMPEGARFAELVDADWQAALDEYPETATVVGAAGYNHRWSDASLAGVERRKLQTRAIAEAARSIDREALGADDTLNYDLFLRQAEQGLEGTRFPSELLAISPMRGPQHSLPMMLSITPATRDSDFDDVLSRLDSADAVIAGTMERLREGLNRGVTVPRPVLHGVAATLDAQVVTDASASPMLGGLRKLPARVLDEATRIVASKVVPAFTSFRSFFVDEYEPAARTTIGLSELPDGEEWYGYLARAFTTTTLSPKEIHEIGIGEVERIRTQMDEVMRSTGFAGSFEEFFEFLRTDSRFYFERAEDLLAAYRDIAKRADPGLMRLFGKLPRTTYGVVPVPAHEERRQTTAYYMRGSPEAGRPGSFYANTYDLRSRPKWEMEALTLHEAVPGHHLQISLAAEMTDLPEFRRHARFTAYVEGWGLYAESLGTELGFYTDPYSRFGQLTYEIWRAIRLVVDTGMHALGWSRERAIDFFRANAGKAEHDIVVEVDRYIAMPGQALAYKIGELKFKELRARATGALGERFDVRRFHDEVLRHAALPLDVLEALVDDWIRSEA